MYRQIENDWKQKYFQQQNGFNFDDHNRLLSCLTWQRMRPWCDNSVPCDPEVFLVKAKSLFFHYKEVSSVDKNLLYIDLNYCIFCIAKTQGKNILTISARKQ